MLLEWNEQIKAHLMWIWGGEDGFMKRKREGMLVVTEKNLIFITKTNMSYRIQCNYSELQKLCDLRTTRMFFAHRRLWYY